jgi:hypothetical protein
MKSKKMAIKIPTTLVKAPVVVRESAEFFFLDFTAQSTEHWKAKLCGFPIISLLGQD